MHMSSDFLWHCTACVVLQGGILTGKDCGTSIDHAILVVGFNMTVCGGGGGQGRGRGCECVCVGGGGPLLTFFGPLMFGTMTLCCADVRTG